MAPDSTADLRWIRPPQQARSQETLGRLLDAAEELVAEKGFADATVAEIVRRAGSSVGAFYTRFPDKNGLLYALFERYVEQASATADDALRPERWEGRGVAELLAAVIGFVAGIYREREGLMRVFITRSQTDPEFGAREAQLYDHVAEGLTRLLLARASEIRHPEPERAAVFGLQFTFAALESAILFGESRGRSFVRSDRELIDELTHAYLAYLGVPPAEESP